MDESEFFQPLGQFRIIRRLSVPTSLILHEADTLSLHRVSKNHYGTTFDLSRLLEGVDHLPHIVPIDPRHIPTKGAVFGCQRLDLHHFVDGPIALQAAAVRPT